MMIRILILSICVCFFACDHHHGESHHAHGSDHHVDSDAALTLNAGDKWAADASTRAGMARMQQLVRATLEAEQTREAGGQLAESLEAEYARIVRDCTMQGAPHQMLHIYLAQLTEAMEALKRADAATSRGAAERLNSRLQEFNIYFE